MDSTTKILICPLAGEEYPPPVVPSSMDYCAGCQQSVWRADSSPATDKVLCSRCALKLGGVDSLTEEQKKEIGQYYREHPYEAKRDLASLGMRELTGGEFEDIPELCVVIEQLLDRLRDLRRSAPEQFFGQPVERLYDSLEASVSSFYRAGVSGERGKAPERS
jgi:hypothetical protein